MTLYVSLLKDTEGDVKCLAIGQASGKYSIRYGKWRLLMGGLIAFCKSIDSSVVVEKILPCVKELVVDTNPAARTAVATNISGFAPLLGKDLQVLF